MMIKNILFFILCVILTGVSWGIFQIFGMYTFTIMLIITVACLLSGAPKKSGNNKNNDKSNK